MQAIRVVYPSIKLRALNDLKSIARMRARVRMNPNTALRAKGDVNPMYILRVLEVD